MLDCPELDDRKLELNLEGKDPPGGKEADMLLNTPLLISCCILGDTGTFGARKFAAACKYKVMVADSLGCIGSCPCTSSLSHLKI